MIKQVRIVNFKSLSDVSVTLDPVTILIGRSGTGKTNFVTALRWLRDYLKTRNDQEVQQQHGNWNQVMSATAARPMTVSFELTFDAPGFSEDFQYLLAFKQDSAQHAPHLWEERLTLGTRLVFHIREGKWIQQPVSGAAQQPGSIMLGALTGVREATIAYLILTKGIACHAFPDNVLVPPDPGSTSNEASLADNGGNFLRVFTALHDNLNSWHHIRSITAALQSLKPSLASIDLQVPQRSQIEVVHAIGSRRVAFTLAQESEGFRRLLACLIALYQEPPKQTLIFDEPEKGIYPAGLAILAEEFKGYASKGRGQVLLTTHSPEFLDHFAPEQIRVVEMHDYQTRIGPVAPEQLEALKEQYLETKELLTVDEARLAGTLAEAP